MELPVFIINGFLESGKTSFIKDTIASEDFNDGARSLVMKVERDELVEELLKAYIEHNSWE